MKKQKLIIISEELFDVLGRATVKHNISANAIAILSLESFLKKHSKDLYAEYCEALKQRNAKANIDSTFF